MEDGSGKKDTQNYLETLLVENFSQNEYTLSNVWHIPLQVDYFSWNF